MSAIIRRVPVPPAAAITEVIPPDGIDRSGVYDWTVINPTGSGGQIELVDDPSKTRGAGLPLAAGDPAFKTRARGNTRVYAAGLASGATITVYVVGTPCED